MKKLFAALVAIVLLCGIAGAETYLLADIGEEAEIVDSEYGDDGAYFEEYLIDGMLTVKLGRYAPEDDAEVELGRQFIWSMSSPTPVEIEPISGYPTERYKLHGKGDSNVVFIFTDDWTYQARIFVPADSEADYAEEIERIIASLSIEDDTQLESQPYSFALSDVESYLLLPFETETDTLRELSLLLGANEYALSESDAGVIRLTLLSDHGSLEVDVPNTGDLLPGDLDILSSADLPEALLSAQNSYAFRAATWDDVGYQLPPVRGISVGTRMQDAIDAFAGGEVETIKGESGFTELLSYSIERAPAAEDELWESAELRCYGNNGVIEHIELSYRSAADPSGIADADAQIAVG